MAWKTPKPNYQEENELYGVRWLPWWRSVDLDCPDPKPDEWTLYLDDQHGDWVLSPYLHRETIERLMAGDSGGSQVMAIRDYGGPNEERRELFVEAKITLAGIVAIHPVTESELQ